MPFAARVEPLSTSPEERRRSPRIRLSLGATVGDRGCSARVHDLSTKGLLFETSATLPDDLVQVVLPAASPAQARIVWRHGRFFGCEFVEPIPVASVSAALLQGDVPPRGAPVPQLQEPAAWAESGYGWAKAAVAALLLLAGAGYLIATGHGVLVAAIAVGLVAILVLVVAVAYWAMDNTVNLKL